MIYLASASPRRQELLRQIGIRFEAMPANLEEARAPHESPDAYVVRVALDKARHVAARLPTDVAILGADTEVVLDGEVLGKPRDREHGLSLLRRLQGRTHEVLSALALLHQGREFTAISRSRVTLAKLGEAQIAEYWATGEPADKAGAYAVQGRAAVFIERLEGSYSGVMGLPLYELAQLFTQAGLNLA